MSSADGLGDLLQTTLFTIGGTATSVGRLLVALALVLVALGAASATRRLSYRHLVGREDEDDIAAQTLAKVAGLVVFLLGLDVALHIIGVRPTALFAAGGLFALGAGLAVKDITQSVLSGVMLHLEQTIRPGDVVIVNDRWVRVSRIGARSTSGTTRDGQEVLIPNATLAQSVVTNLTRHDRQGRIDCAVGVSYSSDLDLVRQTLENAVSGLEWTSETRESMVYLKEFGDSSVNYLVTVWIDDVARSSARTSDLNEVVWRSLRRAGIEIAFPQLDVHLHRPPHGPGRGPAAR